MEALISVTSFLGGTLITTILFMMAFVGRINKMEAKIDNLSESLKGHIDSPMVVCGVHAEFSERLIRTESELQSHKESHAG